MANGDLANKIKVTTAVASINGFTPYQITDNAYSLPTKSDTGVFVGPGGDSKTRFYYLNKSVSDVGVASSTRKVTWKACGGIPIYSWGGSIMVGVTTDEPSMPAMSNAQPVHLALAIQRKAGNGDTFDAYESDAWSGSSTYGYSTRAVTIASKNVLYKKIKYGAIVSNSSKYNDLAIQIKKVEVTDTITGNNTDSNIHVYATGFCMKITSSNVATEELQMAIVSLLFPGEERTICSALPSPYMAACYPYITIGASGDILYQTYAKNGAASKLSPSFSDDIIRASNTGVFAVSCMVATDVSPCWSGYSNSLYRIYSGSKELIGDIGERINIGKHEFVYLMHSSYAFRIS